MTLLRLFETVSLSHFKTEKLKAFLTIAGMALGIAVYAGIRFASQNVFESFEVSTQILAGTESRMIVSAGGRMDENDLHLILKIPAVKAWTPFSQRSVRIRTNDNTFSQIQCFGTDIMKLRPFGLIAEDRENDDRNNFLRLLGSDPAAAVSADVFEESGKNLRLTVDTAEVEVDAALTLPDEGLGRTYGRRVMLMDIAAYQELFRDFGKVDRFLVMTESGSDSRLIQQELDRLSGGRLQLITHEDRSREGLKMTGAFRLNLQFLACVSLIVAVLLIYNSVSYAVLKRRRETGILLSIGTAPKTLFRLMTMESLAVGFAAAAAGTLLGYLLSFINVRFMTLSISNLYFPVETTIVEFKPAVLMECLLLGPLLAWAGCALPCLEILKVPPRETFHYQNFEEKFKRWTKPLTAAGLCLLAAGAATARTEWLRIHLLLGFVSPSLLIAGFILLVPVFLRLLTGIGKKLAQFTGSLPASLALDHIQSTLQRNTVAVASAMIAVGMFLAMSTMILSFRGTVEQWIKHVTKADLFISSPYAISGFEGGYLPDALVKELPALDAVEMHDWISSRQIPAAGIRVKVNGVRFEPIAAYDRLLFEKPLPKKNLQELLEADDLILVSETFSNRTGLRAGDSLALHGAQQTRAFRIASVFYDYSSDQGVILMKDRVFANFFNEPRKQGLALYLKPGRQAEEIRTLIANRFPGASIDIRENKVLRAEVMRIFDQTFRITYALQWIALLIAAFSILNTILMLTLERSREFSVLRALGAAQRTLIRMIVYEALLLGAAAAAGGVLVGLALACVLVFVVNKFFFAWSVVFSFPWPVLFSTLAGVLILSALAGWVPARFFVRKIDGSMLRYE